MQIVNTSGTPKGAQSVEHLLINDRHSGRDEEHSYQVYPKQKQSTASAVVCAPCELFAVS